jgi:hypothetical protein
VATTRCIEVIWFDDELRQKRQPVLASISNWLRKQESARRIHLRIASTLSEFADELQKGPPVDLLMIDVMLQFEPAETFEALGFPEERLLRLDAGVQVVGLIRNRAFQADRPAWLRPYETKRVVLLSSSTVIESTVATYVDGDRCADIVVIVKAIEAESEGVPLRADVAEPLEDIFRELAQRTAMRREGE